jgi:TonB-linked SusC/RagA family outer membrane protein
MKRIKLLLLLAFVCFGLSNAFAQTKITGQVTSSEDGQPIPGVSILVKGLSGVGTSTNIEGKYTLNVPAAGKTLVFSYVGYKSQEVAIGGRAVVDVVLLSVSKQIDELVVTAIGIKKSTKALGYSVQDVKSDKIAKSSNVDVVNSLSGKVAGIQVTNSGGVAGASSFVEIRGSSSLTGNNQPLFVIDGIPVISGGGIGDVDGVAMGDRSSDINPNDVESISVLKGGAATALYGLRAANGVIIVTTKKGKAGERMKVNFSSSVTFDKISQTQALQSKFSQGFDGNYYGPTNSDGGKKVSWGDKVSNLSYTTNPKAVIPGGYSMDTYMQMWDPSGLTVLKTDPLANGNLVNTYDPYDFFKTGISTDNSISISSGTETSTFYLSLSNSSNNGIVPENKFDRNSFKISSETKLTKKFSVETSVTYVSSVGDRIQQGSNTSGVMLGLLRSPATFDNNYGYQFADGRQRCYRGFTGYDNPYWVVNNIKYKDKVNRMISYAGVKYDPYSWLNISYKAGIDWYSRGYKDYFAINSNSTPGGKNNVGHSFNRDINSDLIVTINKNITPDITSTLMLGQNMYEQYYETTDAKANGLLIPNWSNMANTSDNRGFEGTSKKRTAALYANLDLAYKSMIYLTGTVRNEWSTTLPEGKNSFLYPSVSGGFVFTELGALKGNSILSFGKIRASWAQIANDAQSYATKTYWNQAANTTNFRDGWTDGVSFPFGGTNGYTFSNNLGNTNLKPEKTTTVEFGLDLRFLNNRINADLGWYKKRNEDLLLYVPVASSSGASTVYMNAATMETKGLELSLNADVVKTNDFNWNLALNFANPKTEVKSLADGVDNITLAGFTGTQIRAVAGQPYRTIYATGWERDKNGNKIISDDPEDSYKGYPIATQTMKPLGAVSPKWILGINNSIRWKGIELSALLEIKHGGLMWNGTRGALMYFGTSKETENRDNGELTTFKGVYGHMNKNGELVHFDKDGKTELAGAGSANVDKVDANGQFWHFNGAGNGFTGPSEDDIEKTDWVRLREVTLSYSFDLKNSMVKNVSLYFTGRNLFLSTPYTGIDPETSLFGADNAQGCDYFNMPGTKGYTFGLKVNF